MEGINEKQFVDRLIPFLSKHFDVQTEVYSKCGRGRIDLLIKAKGHENIYFGCECKIPDSKRGEEMGEYFKQAIRYTGYEFEVEFGVFKKIPIFICPPLSYKYFLLNEEAKEIDKKIWHLDRHSEFHEHHTMNGFMGAFNVGELRKGFDKEQYFFISFSNKPIWSSRIANIYDSNNQWVGKQMKGLHEKFYSELMKKLCK